MCMMHMYAANKDTNLYQQPKKGLWLAYEAVHLKENVEERTTWLYSRKSGYLRMWNWPLLQSVVWFGLVESNSSRSQVGMKVEALPKPGNRVSKRNRGLSDVQHLEPPGSSGPRRQEGLQFPSLFPPQPTLFPYTSRTP